MRSSRAVVWFWDNPSATCLFSSQRSSLEFVFQPGLAVPQLGQSMTRSLSPTHTQRGLCMGESLPIAKETKEKQHRDKSKMPCRRHRIAVNITPSSSSFAPVWILRVSCIKLIVKMTTTKYCSKGWGQGRRVPLLLIYFALLLQGKFKREVKGGRCSMGAFP